MPGLEGLMHGFELAFQPQNLLFALIGTIVGTLVGVLPGIGPALTIALLLPLTYTVDPSAAFIMFAGIYYGAMYGGSTTAILLKTPGESGSVITAIDGNRMARMGRGATALATAAIGSFIAGTIATMLVAFFAPWIVDIAVQLGPQDYLALMVVAFLTVSALVGSSPLRGLIAMAVGLAISLIGIDFQSGQQRLTFGLLPLLDGIDTVVLIVALFAIGELFYVVAHQSTLIFKVMPFAGRWMNREDWRRSWKPWLRGTAIGFPLGVIPAGGSEIPTFLSYTLERRLSKRPEEFGHGAIEGVAGPEAANNANAAGTMVPLLTLGIPTSATAAVILVAFQQYGIQTGPQLLETNGPLVWSLIASLVVANAILLLLNLPLVGLWVKLLKIPKPYMFAGIATFAVLGAYAAGGSTFDVGLLLVLGVLGYVMRRFGYPVSPLIVGAILGPIAEVQFRRALDIAGGDPVALVSTPFTWAIYGTLAVVFILTFALRGRPSKRDVLVEVSGLPTTLTPTIPADDGTGAQQDGRAQRSAQEQRDPA